MGSSTRVRNVGCIIRSTIQRFRICSEILHQDMKNLPNEDQEAESRPISSNSLLITMFQNNYIHVDEVTNYLTIPKIHFDDCLLLW